MGSSVDCPDGIPTTRTVAALYVSRKGPYWTDPRCDCWDEERDARRYDGPLPVVAHPPCQLWTNITGVNYRRYAGAHNRPANDGGCFAAALRAVNAWGGVLEHPACSYAWNTFGLTRPTGPGWLHAAGPTGNYAVCQVSQSAYGHRARKRTWLYYAGSTRPPELNWSDEPGTHQCGWFDRNKPTLGKAAASATPPAFAELLISIAQKARKR